MGLRQAILDYIEDNPGITREELHKWATSHLSILPRLRTSIVLWDLEEDGQIRSVDAKSGQRHYHPAGRGEWRGSRI